MGLCPFSFRRLDFFCNMKKWTFLLLAGILSLLAAGCRTGGGTPVYDVVVVGGGHTVGARIEGVWILWV
jgi:hypothetical protein